MLSTKRPVFLNVFQITLPITALISILHRVTGVVLIFAFPILMYMYYGILGSQEGFAIWQQCLGSWLGRLFSIGVFAALFYHMIAGMRHMWHDFSGQHDLLSMKKSAKITLFFWLISVSAVVYRILIGG
jgi:succinate dehydrogenase / fumarate reductase, cytochrome b subunit